MVLNFGSAMPLDSAGVYDVTFTMLKVMSSLSNQKGSYLIIKTGQYKGKEGNTPAEFKTMIQLSTIKKWSVRFIFQ
jgi:hypothetical protein